ncbi:hypothetical protein PVL29_023775 [Vitis rotundifolia]|uniref:EF-hand domain-containing protein n=1 Tax=Vitis rotundifolia TaxID=103349 RepID=A0AA38YPU3_VITRO|nr:hypothetical protein PVL29_023775 [Vitis rotundifolia]
MFKQHNANGDGSLSLKEVTTAFRAHLSLIHANTNEDRKISSKEMETLINYTMSLGYQIK